MARVGCAAVMAKYVIDFAGSRSSGRGSPYPARCRAVEPVSTVGTYDLPRTTYGLLAKRCKGSDAAGRPVWNRGCRGSRRQDHRPCSRLRAALLDDGRRFARGAENCQLDGRPGFRTRVGGCRTHVSDCRQTDRLLPRTPPTFHRFHHCFTSVRAPGCSSGMPSRGTARDQPVPP